MTFKAILFPFLLLLTVCSIRVKAETIYVSTKGSDKNNGTVGSPLRSLEGARDRIRYLRKAGMQREPFEVIIAGGSYYMSEPLELGFEDSGSPDAPVTFKAQTGAKPVFYGGIPVTGFKAVNNKLWKADLIKSNINNVFEQLYVNDRRAICSRAPNNGFFQPVSVKETIIKKGSGDIAEKAKQQIVLTSEAAEFLKGVSLDDLQNIVVTFYHKWDITRKRIEKFDVNNNSITISGRGMKSWNKLDKNTLFYFENFKRGLDSAGEWFLSQGSLYYIPKAGESIGKLNCIAPLIDKFVEIKGTSANKVQYLNFKNLTFKVVSYITPKDGNEPMQAGANIEAAFMIDYAKNIEFNNCEVAQTGANAIWFRKECFNSKVQHNYLHDLGAGGIKVGDIKLSQQGAPTTSNIEIDNNIIRSGGFVFPCAVALISFHASDNSFTHNEIADFKYSGISVGWAWGYGASPSQRNKIEFNHIHHLGWGQLSDMGGVYTLGNSKGTTINNNVIHDIYANTYGGWGVYTDAGTTDILVSNNLIYNCKDGAFHQDYGKNNIIKNNIFYNQIHAQLEAAVVEKHVGFYFSHNVVVYNRGSLFGTHWDSVNSVVDSNLYWNSSSKKVTLGNSSFSAWQKKGKDSGSIIDDPQFEDPLKLNFKMLNSRALNKIGFIPFEYSKAGVYGSAEWKKLANLDSLTTQNFVKLLARREP